MYLVAYYYCYEDYRVLDLSREDSQDYQYYYEGQFHSFGEEVSFHDSSVEAELEMFRLRDELYQERLQEEE